MAGLGIQSFQAVAEDIFMVIETTMQCESLFNCVLEILLLTYLLTYLITLLTAPLPSHLSFSLQSSLFVFLWR